MLKAGGVKTKPAYPIVSCRGKVCLPEDTKQTVFGRATSPLRTKRQHHQRFDTTPFLKVILCFHLSGKLIYNLLSHITAAEIFYSWAFGVKVVFLVTILF